MPKLLETVDLVTNFYTYEGVVCALNGISLTIEHGVTFGLVGESGCGKSVLVRSLMRIIQEPGRIDGGRILFVLLEAIRGRRIPPEREAVVHLIGMVILVGLMLLVMLQDFLNPIIPWSLLN